MTQNEIRMAIDEIIEEMTEDFSQSRNQFVLNNNMIRFQQRIENLQNQCDHKFENGICIYCDKVED